jgi:hypothetical protein
MTEIIKAITELLKALGGIKDLCLVLALILVGGFGVGYYQKLESIEAHVQTSATLQGDIVALLKGIKNDEEVAIKQHNKEIARASDE